MTLTEIITVIAIIAGPSIGVWLAKKIDAEREARKRREDVFKILMRTRRDSMAWDHVGALNLVELEFENDKDVISAFKNYFEHLGKQHTKPQRETPSDFDNRLAQERQALLAKLLHKMAEALNFKIEQLEIFEGGYMPQGWQDDRAVQRLIQSGSASLLYGQSALNVKLVSEQQENPEKASEKAQKTP